MTDALDRDDVKAAIRDALEDGVRDDLAGGVPVDEIAARVDRSPESKRLREHLAALERDDEVAEVWGLNPESGYSRTSYLPTDSGNT